MKHGFTVAIIALAPVFVAVQNQPSGAQDRQKTQQAIPAVPVSVNCNCTAQTENGKNKPQGWHKLVAWPEGVETWAILFTLGAIIWQAAEIRRSVNIATRTLVTTFRPRVSVRGIKMDPASGLFYDRRMDKRWKIDLHITKCSFKCIRNAANRERFFGPKISISGFSCFREGNTSGRGHSPEINFETLLD